jgi:hypothetical protein
LLGQSPWRSKISGSDTETLGGFPVEFLIQVVRLTLNLLCSTFSSFPPTLWNHWSFYLLPILTSSKTSCSCDHEVYFLFRLASFLYWYAFEFPMSFHSRLALNNSTVCPAISGSIHLPEDVLIISKFAQLWRALP